MAENLKEYKYVVGQNFSVKAKNRKEADKLAEAYPCNKLELVPMNYDNEDDE